jgi:hypothetical protein
MKYFTYGVVGALVLLSTAISVRAIDTPQSGTKTDPTVYVTKTGTKYHLDGCRSLSRSKIAMKLSEAARRYGPCSICRPPVPESAKPAPRPAPKDADDPTVYITKTGSKYHKAGCRSLSKSAIPMKLSEASKRYGPCSVCKPRVPKVAEPVSKENHIQGPLARALLAARVLGGLPPGRRQRSHGETTSTSIRGSIREWHCSDGVRTSDGCLSANTDASRY